MRVDGRRRAVVESVRPSAECGRVPVKRVAGDRFEVTADVFADGHDRVALLEPAGLTDAVLGNS